MFKTTLLLTDDVEKIAGGSEKMSSKYLSDMIVDYQFACLYNQVEMKNEQKEELERKLQEALFTAKRLFDAENNTEHSSMLVAIMLIKNYEFTEDVGILCIEQLLKDNPVWIKSYGGGTFFLKCLCERMVEDYLDSERRFCLKEYYPRWAEANRIEMKVVRDEVREVFAYGKNGELVEYLVGDDLRVSGFMRKLERETGDVWEFEPKKQGSSDCSLVRK